MKIQREGKHVKLSVGERVFDIFNVILMVAICFLCIYPIWYIVVNSFNDAKDAAYGGIYWWPRVFSLENYRAVFATSGLLQSFKITILKTVIGTTVSVLFTAIVSYSFSKKYLVGRKIYMAIGTITMIFSGGLIPTFILFRSLHLYNNFLVFILPAMFSFYNALIMMSFFRELPPSLEESARIDGAGDFTVFFKIVLPLSKPVIATIALFNGVGQWNDYFSGVMYINERSLEPIQTYLYRIIAESSSNQMVNAAQSVAATTTSTAIKLATMVITTVPIMCVYPFLQKYFVKGMMIGAVKE
ncbi:MAG: carbohydrate ABC transporter permease [Lachnospiraceae bacterium]